MSWRSADNIAAARRAASGCPTPGACCIECCLLPCPEDLRHCWTCALWHSERGHAGRCLADGQTTSSEYCCDYWQPYTESEDSERQGGK